MPDLGAVGRVLGKITTPAGTFSSKVSVTLPSAISARIQVGLGLVQRAPAQTGQAEKLGALGNEERNGLELADFARRIGFGPDGQPGEDVVVENVLRGRLETGSAEQLLGFGHGFVGDGGDGPGGAGAHAEEPAGSRCQQCASDHQQDDPQEAAAAGVSFAQRADSALLRPVARSLLVLPFESFQLGPLAGTVGAVSLSQLPGQPAAPCGLTGPRCPASR